MWGASVRSYRGGQEWGATARIYFWEQKGEATAGEATAGYGGAAVVLTRHTRQRHFAHCELHIP